jgi:hypothetical protein
MIEETIEPQENSLTSEPQNPLIDKTKTHGPKPKKPMSSYFHFMIEKSKESKFSKKEIAELWGLMDLSMRQKYVTMAEAEKKRYMEWMRDEDEIQKAKATRQSGLSKNLKTIKERGDEYISENSGDEANPDRIQGENIENQFLEDDGQADADDPNDGH